MDHHVLRDLVGDSAESQGPDDLVVLAGPTPRPPPR